MPRLRLIGGKARFQYAFEFNFTSPQGYAAAMFTVSEAEAATVRAAYEQEGEFSAAIELRRLFPGIRDGAQAREFARVIAGWKPLPTT